MKKLPFILCLIISVFVMSACDGSDTSNQRITKPTGEEYITSLSEALVNAELIDAPLTNSVEKADHDSNFGDFTYRGYTMNVYGAHVYTYTNPETDELLKTWVMVDVATPFSSAQQTGGYAMGFMASYFEGDNSANLLNQIVIDDISTNRITEFEGDAGMYEYTVDRDSGHIFLSLNLD